LNLYDINISINALSRLSYSPKLFLNRAFCKSPVSSFRRKSVGFADLIRRTAKPFGPESSLLNAFWTPAFAGVTEFERFARPSEDTIKKEPLKKELFLKERERNFFASFDNHYESSFKKNDKLFSLKTSFYCRNNLHFHKSIIYLAITMY
jgi:hypothetical protein